MYLWLNIKLKLLLVCVEKLFLYKGLIRLNKTLFVELWFCYQDSLGHITNRTLIKRSDKNGTEVILTFDKYEK